MWASKGPLGTAVSRQHLSCLVVASGGHIWGAVVKARLWLALPVGDGVAQECGLREMTPASPGRLWGRSNPAHSQCPEGQATPMFKYSLFLHKMLASPQLAVQGLRL